MFVCSSFAMTNPHLDVLTATPDASEPDDFQCSLENNRPLRCIIYTPFGALSGINPVSGLPFTSSSNSALVIHLLAGISVVVARAFAASPAVIRISDI